MNATETKQDWVTKWKALSTKKKIMYVVGIIVATQLLGGLLTIINPPPNPCDCADVASKAEIIGYDNLTSNQQDLYRNCESRYTYSSEAYEACVDKYK